MVVYHEYLTSYTSKSELLNFINTPEFFYKIMDGIEIDKYKFKPDIKKNLFSEKYIKWPQSISYFGPSINCFTFNIPYLTDLPFFKNENKFINSTFFLKYDELYCDIGTKINNIEVELNFKMKIKEENDYVKLVFECLNSDELIIPNLILEKFISSYDYILKSIFC